MKKQTKGLYKFSTDCGRMGSLEGIFIDTKERVDKLISSGIEVYFGEVLGKHSEITGVIEKKDITLVTDDENVLKALEKVSIDSGFNPFNYTSCGSFDIEELNDDTLDEDSSVGEIIDSLIKNGK